MATVVITYSLPVACSQIDIQQFEATLLESVSKVAGKDAETGVNAKCKDVVSSSSLRSLLSGGSSEVAGTITIAKDAGSSSSEVGGPCCHPSCARPAGAGSGPPAIALDLV